MFLLDSIPALDAPSVGSQCRKMWTAAFLMHFTLFTSTSLAPVTSHQSLFTNTAVMIPAMPLQAYHSDSIKSETPKFRLLRMSSRGPGQMTAALTGPTSGPDGRPAVRRLNSLASLHQLNPFSKRRSFIGTDKSPSSALKASTSASTLYEDNDSVPLVASLEEVPPPVPPKAVERIIFNRRNSWIPVPEKPAASLPRSRTLSNLPMPTHTLRHSRLPSIGVESGASMSRIPTPSGTKNIVRPRMPPGPKGILKTSRGRGLSRSDTEPLLTRGLEKTSTSLPKTTAFKENLSLSPVRTLPKSLESNINIRSQRADPNGVLQFSNSSSNLYDSPTVQTSRPYLNGPTTQSSPIKRYSAALDTTQSVPSAPAPLSVLTNMNQRRSFGTEIKQHQLLSPKHPPTPTPKTPISSVAEVPQRRSFRKTSVPIREEPECSPSDNITTPRAPAVQCPDEVKQSKW